MSRSRLRPAARCSSSGDIVAMKLLLLVLLLCAHAFGCRALIRQLSALAHFPGILLPRLLVSCAYFVCVSHPQSPILSRFASLRKGHGSPRRTSRWLAESAGAVPPGI